MKVVVTGCSSDFGTALLPRLFADGEIESIVGLDLRPPRVEHAKFGYVECDVRSPELEGRFAGCDAAVHLAYVVAEIHDKRLTYDVNFNGSRNVIESADRAGVSRLVIASSAASYGIHPDHPDPITEDEFPRGNEDRYYFYDKAEVEHFIEWWQARHPESPTTITRLRPPFIVGPDITNAGVAAFCLPAAIVPGGVGRLQLLHQDDLASAFHLAIKQALPGAYNLAPDDSITTAEMAAVHGQKVARVPERAAALAADALFALRLSPASSDWVVGGEAVMSADRFKAASGWWPRLTSHEAFHAQLLQRRRPILRSRGELERRGVAEAALAVSTRLVSDLCERVPGLRETIGGAKGFAHAVAAAEHEWLGYRGKRIHLETHEAGPGAPTLIYSPGLGGHARFWTPAFGALRERGINVIGVDRPGHGLSQGRRGDATMLETIEVLEAAVRHARSRFAGPVLIAGSSLGGIITWYALTHELDVDGAICGNLGHPDVFHERAAGRKAPLVRALARLAPGAPVPIKQIGNFDAIGGDPAITEFFRDERDGVFAWSLSARSAASLASFRPRHPWSELTTPALVLTGLADRMVTPSYVRECFERSAMPTARLVELEGVGHGLFHEHLPQTLGHVETFVAEVAAATTAGAAS